MFNCDQFDTFADSVDKMVPTDRRSQTELQFVLPGNNLAKAEYVQDYTSDGQTGGTVMIYWDYDGTDFANKTEVDSLQYAIDTVEGLIRMHGGNTDKPAENPYANATIDDIADDIVTYLYDNYPGASYIGDKEGQDGSVMLRFDWGKEDQAAIQNELKERYGDRIKFTGGQLKYAPEIKLNFIRVLPIKSLAEAVDGTKIQNIPSSKYIDEDDDIERQVADSIDTAMMDHYDMMNGDIGDFESVGNSDKPINESVSDEFVRVPNFPEWALEPMVNDSWGDWVTYYGEVQATEDFAMIDKFMTDNGFCDVNPPSDEEYQKCHNEFNSHPAFGLATSTVPVYGVKGKWNSLIERFDLQPNEPVMEAATMETEEIVDGPEVIELDETKSVSSDPLVEYLQSLQQFEGWDPASIQVWAMDNRDTIQEYYNQCKDLNKAVQMCFDADSDKFYDDFNKYESVKDAKKAIFTESITNLCEKAGHPEIGEAVVKLMEAIEAAECTGDCVQLDEEPNFDVTIAVDTLDPNPAHYRVAGYDAMDALEKVANDLKTKGHVGYFEDNPTYEEDYYEVAGTFIPSWLVNIEKID